MRRSLLSLLLLLPAFAWAEPSYSPRFARVAENAEVLSWDLCPRPEYPKASARNEEQGTVTLSFVVGADGRLRATRVARSSGFPVLDATAKTALAQCRFRPASIDGEPVQMTMLVQYVWSLEE